MPCFPMGLPMFGSRIPQTCDGQHRSHQPHTFHARFYVTMWEEPAAIGVIERWISFQTDRSSLVCCGDSLRAACGG
jgi:hypothetical protein